MGSSQSKSTSKIDQKKYNSFLKTNNILSSNQSLNNNKTTPMEPQPLFKTIHHQKDKEIQIVLNNKYFIKPDHQLYQTIDFLVQLINQKNQHDKGKIPHILKANYFSSIQFILGKAKMEQQKCMICLQDYQIQKDIQKQLAQSNQHDIYALPCSHRYHRACLLNLIQEKQWVKCPVCSVIYGKMTGDQPEGTISMRTDNNMTCPGHPKGTIIISYHFNGCVRNGKNVPGTSRTGYLPDTQQGRQISMMLEQAFNRKLVFTVGRSVTTGMDNQIVWNGIHHKTALNGGASSFGYPDETYLKRVKQQLALKGIYPQDFKNKNNKKGFFSFKK